MTRSDAIRIFGSTHKDLADALGITRSAVSQWPDVLTTEQQDRVVGAAVRLGVIKLADQMRDREAA
jgi:UTP--glucose-1-phosphate uridylyltransferase